MPPYLTGSTGAVIGNIAKIGLISIGVVFLVRWGMRKANINSVLLG